MKADISDKSPSWGINSQVLLIIILLCLGLLIRVVPVITDTVHFSFDQGLDMIMVKQLAVDHKINLISRYSGLQGVLMGPVWTWFLLVPFIISGGNPAANVIFLSLFSVACAFLTFLLVKKTLGKPTAWITVLFLLFCPAFIGASQVVLSPHPLVPLFFFYIYFCYQIFYQDRKSYWLALGLLIGLEFQFEIAFAIFTLPALIPIILFSGKWKTIFSPYTLLGLSLLGLTFVPQILFDLRHDFLITNSLVTFARGHNTSLYREASPFGQRVISRIGSFREDAMAMAYFIKPLPWTILSFGISIIGWLAIIKKKKQAEVDFLKILLAIVSTFFLGFSLYPGPIWGWYRAGLPIVYILFLTIPLGFLWHYGKATRIVCGVLFAILLYQAINPLEVMKNLIQPRFGFPALKAQKQVLDQVYAVAKGGNFNYFAYTPPVYDYIWQYDFWWYGRKHFGYLPNNWHMGVPLLGIGSNIVPPKDNTEAILIIEPDSERPWAPSGWEKSFIKVSKVLEEKPLPLGIIVKKVLTKSN